MVPPEVRVGEDVEVVLGVEERRGEGGADEGGDEGARHGGVCEGHLLWLAPAGGFCRAVWIGGLELELGCLPHASGAAAGSLLPRGGLARAAWSFLGAGADVGYEGVDVPVEAGESREVECWR